MCKMLAEVNVLRALPSSNDVVGPFDAARVVFSDRSRVFHRKVEVLTQSAEIDHFRSCRRHSDLLRL